MPDPDLDDFDMADIMATIEEEDDDELLAQSLPFIPKEVTATLPDVNGEPLKPLDVDEVHFADWSDLTELEVTEAVQIRASQPSGPADYCKELLRLTKTEFDATGAGYTYMFLVFSRKLSAGEFKDAFKNRAQVKMSRIRRAAAQAGHTVPDFMAAIMATHPVKPDGKNMSNTWFIRCARFHPDTYRSYLALVNRRAGSATSLTNEAISYM